MSKKKKLQFRLPLPEDTGKEYIWKPVPRVGVWIPWGYKQDPEDPDMILPIPEELELLEQAKKYLKQYSLRDVAAWLSEASGRPISHVGLMKRIKVEYKRRTEAENQRYYAERCKEALAKAVAIEERSIGYRIEKTSGKS